MKDAERQLRESVLREAPEVTADLLGQLDSWLREHRPDYYSHPLPGATADELDGFERHFGLPLPASFRALSRWRNGQRSDCPAALEDNRCFLPLDAVASTKELLDGMIGH